MKVRMKSKVVIYVLILVLVMPMLTFSANCVTETSISSLISSNNECTVSGGYLLGVESGITTTEFLTYFESSNITVSNKSEYVGTGSVIRLMNGSTVIEELRVVVDGDTNGDGEINAIDYLRIKRAFLGSYTLSGEFLLSGCVSGGADLSAKDYLIVKRHFLGTYDLYGRGNLDYNGTKIAYVPIDDRPVNVDRVKYLAESAGFELLMPVADLYSTKLDGTGTNLNGTKYGDRDGLKDWLETVDGDCDYFVISLDQMMSGGLVNSRVQNNTDLSEEYEIIDYLIELNNNNKVYFFDTVMRLASTLNYNGYVGDEYTILRNYGRVARKTLNGADLTIEKIIAGYKYDINGGVIPCSLPTEELDAYLAARARKLKIIDYFLTTGGDDLNYFYIGVDDSSPTTTIQTNEINYIKRKIKDNGILFAGCDELGMMCIARHATEIYRQHIPVAVKYFGGGENMAADSFDIDTLKNNVEDHLTSIRAVITTPDKASMEVLVLTKPKSLSLSTYSNQLLDRLELNIKNKIPTVVIDASTQLGTLQGLMKSREIPLSTLIGYSSWNTVGNAIGIAVSQGMTRMAYLEGSKNISSESTIGFMKSMTFAYIKDINYKIGNLSKTELLTLINGSQAIISLHNYKTASAGIVTISAYRYPWKRSFEATFDIWVK